MPVPDECLHKLLEVSQTELVARYTKINIACIGEEFRNLYIPYYDVL